LISVWDGSYQERNRDTDFRVRFVVDLTAEQASRVVNVEKTRFWSVKQWQLYQKEYCSLEERRQKQASSAWIPQELKPITFSTSECSHGNLDKKIQGEMLANFLVHMILHKLNEPVGDTSTWATTDLQMHPALCRAVEYLNRGSGVIDAAGGSGHVSLALGRLGIHATVVDSRESVGRLPGRDRKAWNRLLRKQAVEGTLVCQPVQFNTLRAWFGSPPEGVNESFRQIEADSLPICGSNHILVQNCTAIVGLHPDEGTDAVVDTALAVKVPFVIVPCCVFFRLFPNRRLAGSNEVVSTRQDLLKYLSEKDSNIQRAALPFEGANTVLWSTF
jgi:hypothetical protein